MDPRRSSRARLARLLAAGLAVLALNAAASAQVRSQPQAQPTAPADPLASPKLPARYENDVPTSLMPPAIQGMDIIERPGEQVPLDLEFINAQGQPVKLGALFNQGHKPVVLAMVYYRCPMQCPLILRNLGLRLGQLDWTIGEKFNVGVISFDPTEQPKAARERQIDAIVNYDRPHPEGLENAWSFMTGPALSSRTLAKSLGFPYRYLPESGEYSHGAVIFVLTPDGKISRYLYGVDFPADRLRMALLEASDGKIGTTWDRVLLFCFHFDPTANAYVLQAFRVMQIGASACALALGTLLTVLWIKDRRRRSRHLASSATVV